MAIRAETWLKRILDTLSGFVGGGTSYDDLPKGIRIAGIDGTQTETATSAVNANATITYAAQANVQHVIDGVAWSYDNAPTGGRITITSGGIGIFDIDITEAGAGKFEFLRGKRGFVGTNMILTIYAGGAGVVGKLNVLDYWTE